MQDERLSGAGNRASKQTVNRRTSRAAQDRAVKGNRTNADAIRRELFRSAHAQSALPNIPPISGYHVCWLSTNNNKDTLAMRKRLGYEHITPEEMVGFGEFAEGQSTTADGMIHVNEMVAFKLPLHIYQEYMQYNHHDAPAEQDSMLTSQAQQIRRQARGDGTRADIGEGVDEDGLISQMATIEAPDFTENEPQ